MAKVGEEQTWDKGEREKGRVFLGKSCVVVGPPPSLNSKKQEKGVKMPTWKSRERASSPFTPPSMLPSPPSPSPLFPSEQSDQIHGSSVHLIS